MGDAEPQRIDHYTIIRLLNENPISYTYLGKDEQHKKRYVIIKIYNIPLFTKAARESFLTYAKQLKKLRRNNITETHNFGFISEPGKLQDLGYHVIEYIQDIANTEQYTSGNLFAPDQIKPFLSTVADTLQYAHVSQVLHGNLHPGNILFGEELRITDFSPMPQEFLQPFNQFTTRGLLYKAPEHLQGILTPASDQYSLAVIVYEWLCGQRPYSASSHDELLHQQEHEPIPSPRHYNSKISPNVEAVILKALSPEPTDRFEHMLKFSDAYLRALMGFPLKPETRRIMSLSSTTQNDNDNINKDIENQDKQDRSISNKKSSDRTSKFIPSDGKRTEDDINKKTPIHSNMPPMIRMNEHNQMSGFVESATEPYHLLNQRYQIISILGQGGMGKVFKAKDIKFERLVALKEMIQSDKNTKAAEDFKREAAMLAKLTHPNLPSIHDHFNDLGRWYLVMSYIEGENLEQYLRKAKEERLPIEEVLEIGIQLCTVLDYLHNNKPIIIFRDLKPSNVMRTSTGHFYLIDFGIARFFKPGQIQDTNAFISMGYSAPEQYGAAQTTPRSDIFSLGATLYHLISGKRPLQGSYQFEPIQKYNQPIFSEFKTLIMEMVEFEERKRPENMIIVKKKLEDIKKQLTAQSMKLTQNTNIYENQLPPIHEKLILRPDGDSLNSAITEQFTSSIRSDATSLTNKASRKKKPLGNDFSHLHQIVSTDLGHGGILSERLQGYEERRAQIEMATLVARALTGEQHAIVEAATGTGKALDVDTPIPTPTGWKRMGDLVSGDFVFDEQGHPTRVTAAFDVMHDRTCYEVVFSDGSSIVADAEHEWATHTSVDRSWSSRLRTSTYAAKNFVTSDQLAMLEQLIALSQNDNTLSVGEATRLIGGHYWSVNQAAGKIVPIKSTERPARYPRWMLLTAVRDRLARDLSEQRRDGRAYTLVTTERMAATLKVGSTSRTNHAILVTNPLVLSDANLPIAPYFLGTWLGDGNSYSSQITTADLDLITEIEKAGYTARKLKSHPYNYAVDDENGKAVSRWQPGMIGRLRTLGLLRNKHIPATYLRASEQQRRALLAGLLDTDGTVNRNGAVEFTTTNPRLAQDVYELACSLGFRPSLRCGRSKYNGKDCGPKWTLAFTTDEQVFRLGRKITAHKERIRNYSPERNRFRYVVAVREVPSRPVRCIQVESPSHLYLAGRSMIPTHNSLAYLLPIVRSGKIAIISTANKALQEQLFYKDIPFVKENIDDFDAALVKGMGNYICLDRLDKERIETQPLLKNPDFTRLMNIVQEFELNITGDFETLGFTLPNDIRTRVNADSDQCAWRECPFFSKCYVRQMRDTAAQSQVIVVNHTLLLLDVALDGFLLPKRDVIVIDEAHHLEDEATRAFTVTVSESKISALLAQQRLKLHSRADLQEDAKQTMKFAWDRLDYIMHASPHKGRVILQEPLQEGLRLATIIAKIADSLRELRPEYMEEPENSLYDKLLTRTNNLSEAIRKVFSVDQRETYVYYVERGTKFGRRGSNLEVNATPLEVNSLLSEQLFNESKVICTSATLATVGPNPVNPEDRGPNFAYFRSRVGLDHEKYPDVLEHILPYTFDYENNALLYLPRHLPEPVYGPDTQYYTNKIAEEMMNLVAASQGRAFLLFSSKRMLDAVYNIFLDNLPSYLDFRLLRQGEMNCIELVQEFRASESAILFGLKSFWEGVDIAGDSLSLVVIDKMPFDPPEDPVHEARVAIMKANKENWFGNYVLPQAVLRLKQGLGRLLRTHEDRGVMAILDTRLHTKSYGKLVINALPPARRTEQLRHVENFFEANSDPPF